MLVSLQQVLMLPSFLRKEARNLPQHDKASYERISGSLPDPGKSMNSDMVLEILKSARNSLDSVPSGKKDNVFFIVDNSKNKLRKQACLTSRGKYKDDCGKWDQKRSSQKNTYYIAMPEGKRRMVWKIGNLIWKKDMGKMCPMKPQPNHNRLIHVHRYTTPLMADANYKRRITVVSGEDYDNCRALYEYYGVRTVQNTSHGNNKKRKKDGQSDSKVVKKVTKSKDTSVKPVEEDELNDELLFPCNTDQLYDLKAPSVKKEDPMLSRVTDEKRVLLTMLAQNPRVQAVINQKGKPPCVMMYCDDDLTDMKRNLECENVLGIDCSHKFGDCFVTMTVYQNSRALHKETNEPLLYLGPVFLHWDQEFLTYVHFFSHIIDKVGDIKLDFEVKLGNESSLSLFKALKHSFPESEYMIDYHHLKETATKELHNVCDSERMECSMILEKMFGSEGLTSSSSVSVFLKRASDLTCYLDEFPKFKNYFGGLQLFLYEYVCEPQQKGILPKLWVNDNDEVLNCCLKSVLQQKPHRLSELVEKMSSMSKIQIQNLQDT